MGQLIGIPFLLWLIFTGFDFGNTEQVFAIFGLIGIVLNFTKFSKSRLIKAMIFFLMLTPIAKRLTELPFEKFNYLTFQIPFSIFIITYLILILKPNAK